MDTERAKKYDRLSADDAAVLFIDHQSGLFQLVRDHRPEELDSMIAALADTARLFKLPVVITTSVEKGPNGPLMPQVRQRLPKAPIIRREGEINAWDNPQFVKAVKKTGRKQLIIAGITTDVCVATVALSALEAGYRVYVVADASGALSHVGSGTAMLRIASAGGQLMSWFAVAAELQRDWREDEAGFRKLMRDHVPSYRQLLAADKDATQDDE
jgi:nicotinamidase-related amidase